jgi:membrane-associated phospholipid phosphatase
VLRQQATAGSRRRSPVPYVGGDDVDPLQAGTALFTSSDGSLRLPTIHAQIAHASFCRHFSWSALQLYTLLKADGPSGIGVGPYAWRCYEFPSYLRRMDSALAHRASDQGIRSKYHYDVGRCMGRHPAALGSLITTACLFVALAIGVLTGGPLVSFDRSVADALHTYASEAPSLTDSFYFLGSLEALALVSLLVALALLVQRNWLTLAAWLVAVLGGEVLNLLLKDLFARPRPHFEHPLVVETSYSFPSGQAMESLVVYGMLAYFAAHTLRGPGKRAAAVGGAAIIVVLIGFSRVYLGAHYVSDVVGGFAAGGAWLSAVITAWGAMRRREAATRRDQTSSP